MAFKLGEHYRCPDSACGCELEVTKAANPGCGGDKNPTCCCGKVMERA